MDVRIAIEKRRALRTIATRPVEPALVETLLTAARLAPSCFNNQPWRSVVVQKPETLAMVKETLSKNNDWARNAPLIFAVASQPEDDCQIYQREYHQFDVGLAVSQLVLQATELGLIAHPIAGYSPKKVAKVLEIPSPYLVIALVICGYPGEDDSLLTPQQREREQVRPERKKVGQNFFADRWEEPVRFQ